MGHLVSLYMEDMILFYASVLRHPNQHIRLCLIVYASILVFQLGQEGSTTSSRIPLEQHLKNPKKEAHLKNPKTEAPLTQRLERKRHGITMPPHS